MTDIWNPETTPNFTPEELKCSCGCGQTQMRQDFMEKLQMMRDLIGPLGITSGYRCPHHEEEAKKVHPGSHAQGRACDIKALNGYDRFKVIQAAIEVGMSGIGQANGFVHVDDGHDYSPRPAAWKYR